MKALFSNVDVTTYGQYLGFIILLCGTDGLTR